MYAPLQDILCYMKMGPGSPDSTLAVRIDSVVAGLASAERVAKIDRVVEVAHPAPGVVVLDALEVESRSLACLLRDSPRAFLFALTLGAGVDLLLRRWSQTAPADAVIGQAAAAARVETLCDAFCSELAGRPASRGCRLTPRFSPGYGDLPLAFQRPLLASLDATRRIGVSLTASFAMTPSKSVSAIVGVQPRPASKE